MIRIGRLILLLLLPWVMVGCFDPQEPSPWNPPGVIHYIRTLDINRYLRLDGSEAYGQQTTRETDFDLHCYSVGSAEVFGLRSGWHPDEYGQPIPLRIIDLGEVPFEDVEYLPENGTTAADYRPISTRVISSTDPGDGGTLLRRNHVYAIYRWNPQGGSYLKLFVQRIDPAIARIQIRATFQTRQGVTLVWPSDVPL